MWKCQKCGEQVEDAFDVCWKCGTSREGVEDPAFESEASWEAADLDSRSRSRTAGWGYPFTRLVILALWSAAGIVIDFAFKAFTPLQAWAVALPPWRS